MVDDPVIPKTVQINNISRYQANVYRSGISFGPKNRSQKEELLDEAPPDAPSCFPETRTIFSVSLTTFVLFIDLLAEVDDDVEEDP